GADQEDCGVDPGVDACATIGAALDQVTAGDTVEIATGTYGETLLIGTPVRLQGTGDVTLAGVEAMPTISVDADGPVTIADISVQGADSSETQSAVVHVEPERQAALDGVLIHAAPEATGLTAGVLVDGDGTLAITGSSIEGLPFGISVGGALLGSDERPAAATLTGTSITGAIAGVVVFAGAVTVIG